MDHAVDCMILPINCKGIRRSSKIICYIARFWVRRRMRPLKILLYYAKIHIHEATKGILHLKYIYMKRQKVSSIFQMKDTFSQIRKVSSIFQMEDTP